MQISIREATTKDYPSIYLLLKEFSAFQQTPDKVTITPERMIEEKNLIHCLVAVNPEGVIIGFASYFFAFYSWSGKALYLDDLYVCADYRRQKIGTQLLQKVLRLAKETGCWKVRWQVSKWNDPAISFYKKIGAVVDDVESNCDLLL